MKKFVKKSVTISNENYEKIKIFLSNNNIKFSNLINFSLYQSFQTSKENDLKLLVKGNNRSKSIRVELSQEEFEFLSNLAKSHGFNSAKQEIKFLLLNFISKDKIPTNIEMNNLQNAINNLNKLGRNINEIVKFLREKKSYEFNINFDKLKDILSQTNSQISEINSIITNYQKILNLKVF